MAMQYLQKAWWNETMSWNHYHKIKHMAIDRKNVTNCPLQYFAESNWKRAEILDMINWFRTLQPFITHTLLILFHHFIWTHWSLSVCCASLHLLLSFFFSQEMLIATFACGRPFITVEKFMHDSSALQKQIMRNFKWIKLILMPCTKANNMMKFLFNNIPF